MTHFSGIFKSLNNINLQQNYNKKEMRAKNYISLARIGFF